MSLENIISPLDALSAVVDMPEACAFLDVRSEGEFGEAHLRGFFNVPVLTDQERHLVGTCYKQQGQDAAFALGQQLTAPHKAERVAQWLALAAQKKLIVCCWRGGARSRIACEWLAERGVATWRVRGGYKALRQLLRARLDNPPPLLVLAGRTGVGKTTFLQASGMPFVDLEACACHRGSAFGHNGAQPTQTQFENDVALAIWRPHPRYLIEDESRLIGKVELPPPLKDAMYAAPTLLLEADMNTRVQNIYDEYVRAPQNAGLDLPQLQASLSQNIIKLQKKLGDLRCRHLLAALAAACNAPTQSAHEHFEWISLLLHDYYDPRYDHSFAQQPRQLLCRGDAAQLLSYMPTMS